jgi:type IV pilus assembly protein PilA
MTMPGPRDSLRTDRGFTLVELLVVCLVIGALATIALPVFLSQSHKGQDSAAKSDVRNLVSVVQACYAEREDYRRCDETGELGPTGLPLGGGPGEVDVASASEDGFTVTARSRSGNEFRFVRPSGADAGTERRCDTPGSAGCPADGRW